MTATPWWLTILLRPGPVMRAAAARSMERSLVRGELSACHADAGNRQSCGELLEAAWSATGAGLDGCPGWLIAAIENYERGELSERRLS